MPTRMLWELEHDPDQWVSRILMLRAYAETKRQWDLKPEDVPSGPLKDLVEEFTFGPIEERLARMKAKAGGSETS